MGCIDYFIEKAFLPDGWHNNVGLSVDDRGYISQVRKNAQPSKQDELLGWVMPGLVNCHSHAFQRAMAGYTEYRVSDTDTFWSWRETMYRHANSINPEQLLDISAYLYMELIKQGYTSVAEFHYLHHQPGGSHYPHISQLSESIIGAANSGGINLTLLPTLYMSAGFDKGPLAQKQQRFGNSINSFLRVFEQAQEQCKPHHQHSIGMGFHSLRAVPKEAISETLRHIKSHEQATPVHIHIAEQIKEVEQCIRHLGCRPVEWLLDTVDVDKSWCLVHATHMTQKETIALAKTGATVGLCPSTEANLGDGLFPLTEFLDSEGHIAIGSDGNTCTNPMEEMRLLEYGQRLVKLNRNIGSNIVQKHTGTRIMQECLDGGARSIATKTGAIEEGYRADLLVLDHQSPDLSTTDDEFIMDTLIFAPNQSLIRSVMAAGEWHVRDFRHRDEDRLTQAFIKTLKSLRQ